MKHSLPGGSSGSIPVPSGADIRATTGEACGLHLEDGTFLPGRPFGSGDGCSGEVVFNTGMVGYPETLTDPSYHGQILVLTFPLQGNYGVPARGAVDRYGLPEGFESDRIRVEGLVVSDHCGGGCHSHHSSTSGLHDWLAGEGIPGLSGIDTRALTRKIRKRGTLLGRIGPASAGHSGIPDPNTRTLVSEVSGAEERLIDPDPGGALPEVVLVDCGCKASIARGLVERGLRVRMVPHDHYFPGMDFDGLVISNGPGDPATCVDVVRNVSRALALGKPILGICLGHQILAMAAGASTYKLPFGHRGQNQPCLELPVERGSRCFLTSQNHGYAVEERSLPEDWTTWMRNANDDTVEAIRHRSKPFMGVQFHPEASPGPMDTGWVTDRFAELVRDSSGVRRGSS